MSKLLISLILLVSSNSYAAFVGSSSGELAVDQSDSENGLGLGAKYKLKSINKAHNLIFNAQLLLGAERARSSVSTSTHDYQYDSSFVSSEMEYVYDFGYPAARWSNRASQKTYFGEKNTEDGSDAFVDYSNSQSDWIVSTGPSINFLRGKWLEVHGSGDFSLKSYAGIQNSEYGLTVGVGKSINKITRLIVDLGKNCTYSDEQVCRNQIEISTESKKRYYSLLASYAMSDYEDTLTSLYALKLDYRMNTSSQVDFELFKRVDELSNGSHSNLELKENISSSVKEGGVLKYTYEWGRKGVEFKAQYLTTEVNSLKSVSENASVFYDYQLSSLLCLSCRFESSYEYYSYSSGKDQEIVSVGLKKNISSWIATSLSVRHVDIVDDESWSINFVLSYHGKETRLRNR